jgi:hypothetical protein
MTTSPCLNVSDDNLDAGSDISRPMLRLLLYIALVIAAPASALAWGSEGHRIVAEIAEQRLEPVAAKQVRDLLAIENATTLADVANWPDQIRRQRPETASWHFVDIPITAPAYDPARDCVGGNCVVAKIDQFTAEVRNPTLPARQRLEALKFVVHFVGNLHQPLHASDDNDRGGNQTWSPEMARVTGVVWGWPSSIGCLVATRSEYIRSYLLAATEAIRATRT